MKIVELPPSWSGRALIVAGAGDPAKWFNPGELEAIRAFTREKRRNEWIASRIAEKILRQRGAAGPHVSFSHSGAYGAAAIDRQPIGIDVERIRQISESAAHLFLTDDEAEAMRRCSIADRMLHFWCAKEAVWKQLGGSVATLKRVPLHFEETLRHGLRFDGVETYAGEDFIAALTTDNRQPTTRATLPIS